MRRNYGLIALAMLMACCSFISVEARKSKELIQLNNNFCKSIGEEPVITVCVSGNPGEEFNENSLKALKSSTKSLVHKYKKSQKFVNAKFSTTGCGSQCIYPTDWDPNTCGAPPTPPTTPPPPPTCTDCYCYMMTGQTPPAALNCSSNPTPPVPPPPPDPCVAMPNMPGCPGYVPPPPPTPPAPTCMSPYDWGPSCDPMGQNRSFCQVNPTNTMYCSTQVSLCVYGDWDPNTCGYPSYCHKFPNTSPYCVGLP